MDESQSLLLVGKPRYRFNDTTDLLLLQEVYGQNPYEDSNRWTLIQTNMLQVSGRLLSVRTLKERVQKLLKKYLLKEKENQGK